MSVWRSDPHLAGRFHPDYPDDLQVLVHNGSFRFSQHAPELMWVRVLARLEWTHNDGRIGYVYRGVLLNKPHWLPNVKEGETLLFRAHKEYPHAVYHTHQSAMEQDYCEITPCSRCKLPFLFDPPTALVKLTFPNIQDNLEAGSTSVFTSFCPMCGKEGTLIVNLTLSDMILKTLQGA